MMNSIWDVLGSLRPVHPLDDEHGPAQTKTSPPGTAKYRARRKKARHTAQASRRANRSHQ